MLNAKKMKQKNVGILYQPNEYNDISTILQ